jgi:hypothetical protein
MVATRCLLLAQAVILIQSFFLKGIIHYIKDNQFRALKIDLGTVYMLFSMAFIHRLSGTWPIFLYVDRVRRLICPRFPVFSVGGYRLSRCISI